MPISLSVDLQAALGQFGLSQFRKGQQEVISHIIAGHDCLCVMPTGGGKSLCYQLPSLVRPGLTIVVSPLIALMKDQVDTLTRLGISATLINSTLTTSEQNQRLDHVAGGHYSLLYVAPERLRNPRFMDAIRSTPVQLLAVDEAHCISEWGHDFRPDYQRLGKFRESLGGVQTIALTATATPRVRQDIVDSLKLNVAKHFITGFARDNLYFGCMPCKGDREKDSQLIEFLENETGSGIIYAATRKRCEEIMELLSKELKLSVGVYHAGLMPEQRKLIQEEFMSGRLRVIVATNAFGMGIDKRDLRYVVHYNMPGTIEAYYQEAGRAGRDGLPSKCVLLSSPQDRYIQEFFIENANPTRELLQLVYEFLLERTEDPIELTAEEIRENSNAPATSEAINSCLQVLGRTSVMERLEASGGLAVFRLSGIQSTLVDLVPKDATVRRKVLQTIEKAVGDRRDEPVYIHPRWLMQQLQMERETMNRHLRELQGLAGFDYVPPFRGRAIHFRRRDIPFNQLNIDHDTLAARKKADYDKLEQMIAYAHSKKCRQRAFLEYFGDASATNCGICDRCQGKTGWPRITESSKQKKRKSDSKQEPAIATVPTTLPPTRVIEKESSEPLPVAQAKEQNSDQGKRSKASEPASKLSAQVPTSMTTSDRRVVHELVITLLRSVERTHGYLSKTLLAQHLHGIESKAVQGLRLQRLAEFGILKSWKKVRVTGFLDAALDIGLLELTQLRGNKVTVKLAAKGEDSLHRNVPLPESLLEFTFKSMEEKEISDRAQTHERTLIRDSSASPINEKRAGEAPVSATDPFAIHPEVPEIPNAKADLANHRTQVDLPSISLQDASRLRDPTQATVEDWRWTVRLVQHGYRLGECALIRNRTPDDILEHLHHAMVQNVQFPLDQLFDKRIQIAIRELTQSEVSSDQCPSVFQSYPLLWKFVKKWLEKH